MLLHERQDRRTTGPASGVSGVSVMSVMRLA
jgi:hypothetical protein